MSEKIKWGILSTGQISGKFAEALELLPEAEICAVASRNAGTAKKFAEKHGILKAYGSYLALADDPEVDVVYIGTPHSFHLENSVMCMRAGKSVLCEKALTINAREAEEMIRVAREENVFLMEAMVTRHVLLVKKVLGWIRDGEIGEVRMVKASFCKRADFTPSQRHLNPGLGGGSLLDLGVYGISFASMVLNKPPESVVGFGHIGSLGSDEQGAALLKYDRGEIAELSFALRTDAVNDAYVFGTEGYIKINEIFSIPTKATRYRDDKAVAVLEDTSTGNGLMQEAEEVMRCLKEGLKESPFMPLEESLQIMRIMDKIRAPWELTYSNDIQ
ncbi:MAG: Gfo/Idh/MocA family oxidoreductase [Bacteroidales bacterium]|nr:Gfo/Idh/MocA family oxidoreductase [Bacteroidales bacterium]